MATATLYFHYSEIKGAVYQGFQFFEECLDKAGYVPYLSTISGGIRIFYGQLQIVAAAVLAVFLKIAIYFLPREDREWVEEETALALDLVIHGMANIFRGHVEVLRWVNLLCIIFDRFMEEEKNKLRLRYNPPIGLVHKIIF